MQVSGGALLVGIDRYQGAWPALSGCVRDVDHLDDLLSRHEDGSPNFSTTTMVSSDGLVTADLVLDRITRLLDADISRAMVHFSGHGTVDGDDGGCLVGQDGSTLPLTHVMRRFRDSRVPQKVLTLDCCFAGSVALDRMLRDEVSVIPDGVVVLAASRADEPALEGVEGGVFTSYLRSGLAGGAKDVVGTVTAAGLYAYLDEAFGVMEQRPVLKANLRRLVPLRSCHPQVPLPVLRRLPQHFPDPDEVFALDPSHEPTMDDHDPARVAVFKDLQKCASARLVVPVDLPPEEEHMYFAAIRSTGCRLTRLGQRYWRLAEDGRL